MREQGGFDPGILRRFAASLAGREVAVRIRPLRGGLESGVVKVELRGRAPLRAFVAKRTGARESGIYRAIAAGELRSLAPSLLGAEPLPGGQEYLYLEWLDRHAWPWAAVPAHDALLRQLAKLHREPGVALAGAAGGWDYDAELVESAAATLDVYREARAGLPALTRTLERSAAALPEYRRQLRAAYGETVLHGDAHPGNAIRCKGGSRRGETVLIDWARARLGSPLEDVCSWLHSAGFWEPEARRRHDTLLAAYLRQARDTDRVTRSLRDAYWLAGACNAFAGALRYHLSVLGDPASTPVRRRKAELAARDWLRIIRRADAVWRA